MTKLFLTASLVALSAIMAACPSTEAANNGAKPTTVTNATVYSKTIQAPTVKQGAQYSTAVNMVINQAQKYPNDLTLTAAKASVLQALAASQARAAAVNKTVRR